MKTESTAVTKKKIKRCLLQVFQQPVLGLGTRKRNFLSLNYCIGKSSGK